MEAQTGGDDSFKGGSSMEAQTGGDGSIKGGGGFTPLEEARVLRAMLALCMF
jgi:hypothetical protein